jgi:hypothetical protein
MAAPQCAELTDPSSRRWKRPKASDLLIDDTDAITCQITPLPETTPRPARDSWMPF